MKNLYAIFLIIMLFSGGNMLYAQEEHYSKTAGIYILNITLSEEFIEEYTDANRHGSRNGYSISTILPDSLLKAIKSLSEELFSKKLKADVTCIYKVSKKGERVSTIGWGHVEGMPTNLFKGALASAKMNYYIKIDVMMLTGGEAVFFGKGRWSKIKPRVTANIKIYDEEKNVVFMKKVSIKDFSTLRSFKSTQGMSAGTSPESLGPVDIYMIYEYTMLKLLKGD